MEFPKNALSEIMAGGEASYNDLPMNPVGETMWSHDGGSDFENASWYFEYNGKFYRVDNMRSGSPYSDYWYESESWPDMVECDEVVKVTKTIEVWESV